MKDNIHCNLSKKHTRRLVIAGAASLAIGFYLFMSIDCFSRKSVHFDETAHLASGYFMLKHDDYRVGTANMIFSQKLAALPLLFSDVKEPPPEIIDKSLDGKYTSGGEAFGIGMSLLNDSGNDSATLLFRGRMVMLLFGLITALTVFFWSKKNFGSTGGLISLAFLSSCPVFISFSGIIGTDIVVTALFILTVWSYWTLLHRVTPFTCMLFAIPSGLLLMTKMSSLIFGPVALLLLLIRFLANRPLEFSWGWKASQVISSRWKSTFIIIASLFASALIILIMIWAGYGFRYASVQPDSKGATFNWQLVLDKPSSIPHETQVGIYNRDENLGELASSVRFAKSFHFLPEAFLFDLASLDNLTQSRAAFFLGEISNEGWILYFPLIFLAKSGLPLFLAAIILSVSSLFFLLRKAKTHDTCMPWQIYECLPILIFIAVYMVIVMSGSINIGHRHILPIYPFIYVLLGALVFSFRTKIPWHKIILSLLIASSFITAIVAHPNHLAYISPLFGGTNMGYRLFVDSSIEWGQELPAVKKWIDAHQADIKERNLYFSYFGSGSPEKEGIKSLRLPGFFDPLETNPQSCTFLERLKPGGYLISGTMLQPVYYSRIRSNGTSLNFTAAWCEEFEEEYRKMKRLADALYDISEAAKTVNNPKILRAWMIKNCPAAIPEDKVEKYWLEYLAMFDLARFAKLASFLRHREPDANINYSVYVFFLGDKELELALNEQIEKL
jgi:4-amino-4-deoxy-L-arabinose transferase-like glycosyltransferase